MTNFLTKAALAATVATTLFAAPAFAADDGKGQFDAKAKLVKALTLTKNSDLDFGTIVMDSAHTADADVSVAAVDNADSVCAAASGLTCQGGGAAKFTLTGGTLNEKVEIKFTAPATLDRVGGGSVALALDAVPNITIAAAPTEFFIGGKITVPAGASDGVYTGSVNVTATYL